MAADGSDKQTADAMAFVEGLDTMIAACAGVKQQCVERGFSEAGGETIAVECMVGLVRLGIARSMPAPSLRDLFGAKR